MYRVTCASLLLLVLVAVSNSAAVPAFGQQVDDGLDVAKSDWPWWRGPERNGAGVADQNLPLKWSDSENVIWKTPIPGRGHSSPIVAGNHIYLTTSDESKGSQSVLCFDRKTGKELWNTEVHPSGAMRKNPKASAASSSVACDGQRVFVSFPNSDALMTTALDLKGNKLWQKKVSDYVEHQGYGASPALYQSLVIVSADSKGGGSVAGLNRTNGSIVWQNKRPKLPNYASPIILNIFDKDQLVLTGCDLVASLEPLTGKTLWEIKGATEECVTLTVTDGTHVFSSGGYPRNHLAAIVADGSGKVAWETTDRVYVPSMLQRRDTYMESWTRELLLAGNAIRVKRFGKNASAARSVASPVLVGDKIFATNEEGITFVFSPARMATRTFPRTSSATKCMLRRPSAATAFTCASPPRLTAHVRSCCTASDR